jgi:dihydroorotase
MVHPQAAWCESLDDVLAVLRAGDILTHTFHGFQPHGILDDMGWVRQSVREASERGVIFDVGHGVGSFTWRVAERAVAQGFLPDTISTDLHAYNFQGPVFDLPTTLSKFLHLGLSLDEVIRRVTETPALAIGREGELGTLKTGASGDAVVFDLQDGRFEFRDCEDELRIAKQCLVPVHVVRAGQRYSQV